MARWEYLEHLQAREDARDELEVAKDYAAPGRPGYVVRMEDGERVLSTMKWGFPTRKPRKRPAREGELPFLHDWWTNCRNLSSGMWRPWLLKPEHRCLVPFTRFAEPKAAADRSGPGDTSWWFEVTDQPEPCFAGVWKTDRDHDRVYAFCTTEPNALVAPKHPKAMPVVLMAEDHDRWLHGSIDEAIGLVSAYPSQLMTVVSHCRATASDARIRAASADPSGRSSSAPAQQRHDHPTWLRAPTPAGPGPPYDDGRQTIGRNRLHVASARGLLQFPRLHDAAWRDVDPRR